MIESAGRLAYALVLELFLASALFWVVAVVVTRLLHITDAAWRVRFCVLPLLVPVPLIPLIHLVIRPLFLRLPPTPLESFLTSLVGASPLVAAIFLGVGGMALFLAAVHALRPLAAVLRLKDAAGGQRLVWQHQPRTPLWLRCDSVLQSTASKLQMPPARLILTEGRSCSSFSLGPLGSYIVAPRVLVSALDDEELEGLLAHELSHNRRKDALLDIAVGVCRRLLTFSPFAQSAYRSFARAREEAVDDLAILASGRPLALASCLIKACRLSQGKSYYVPSNALLSTANTLDNRVQRLLDHSSHAIESPRRYHWAFIGAIAVGVTVSLLTL